MTQPLPLLHRVLVATDFSRGGRRAVARTGRLPLALDAHVVVLHVLEPGGAVPVAHRTAQAQARLDVVCQELRARFADQGRAAVTVSVDVRTGRAHETIAAAAGEMQAELLVVGRRGAGGFRTLLLGSTAARLLREAPGLVLVVGAHVRQRYRRPVVGVDLSPVSGHVVLRALQMQRQPPPPIVLVHAVGLPLEPAARSWELGAAEVTRLRREARAQARAALGTFAQSCGLRERQQAVRIARYGDPRHVLLDVAADAGADLIVVGRARRAGLFDAWVGTLAETVVQAATCDVLVVPLPAPDALG